MNSIALKTVSMLVISLSIAGCSILTRITGTTEPKPYYAPKSEVPPVCSVWLEQSYSAKQDSKLTVDEIRINNNKRNAYCEKKAPQAAGPT